MMAILELGNEVARALGPHELQDSAANAISTDPRPNAGTEVMTVGPGV